MKKTIQAWLVLIVMLFGCGSGTTNDNSSVPLCDLPCSVTRADGVTITVTGVTTLSGVLKTTGPLTMDLGQVLINHQVRAGVHYTVSASPSLPSTTFTISPTFTPGVGFNNFSTIGVCSQSDPVCYIEFYWTPSVVGKLEAALTVTTGLTIPITGEGIQ
jgi:hypothetical protein